MTNHKRCGRCETCGSVYDTVSDLRDHLGENEQHIGYQIDLNLLGSGVKEQTTLNSPNGSPWAITIDNDGNLQISPL